MLRGGSWLRAIGIVLVLSGTGCVRMRSGPAGSTGDGGAPLDLATSPDVAIAPTDARTDAMAEGGTPDFGTPPWPGYSVRALELLWSTARSFSWGWQCEGQVPSFDRYAFCVGTNRAALENDTASCLGVDDDFGLGIAACVAADLWHPVTVHGLLPDTTYYVRLSVFDSAGVAYRTPILSTKTASEPQGRVWFFDDALPSGVWLLELTRAQATPHSGQWNLLAEIGDETFHNLHYGGMTLTYPGLDEARFQAAYLEFFIDAPKSVPLCLSLVGGGGTASFCLPRAYASIDGKPGYQRVQVPLRRFRWSDGSPLSAATLPQATKLQLGAEWGVGQVRIDEISLRY